MRASIHVLVGIVAHRHSMMVEADETSVADLQQKYFQDQIDLMQANDTPVAIKDAAVRPVVLGVPDLGFARLPLCESAGTDICPSLVPGGMAAIRQARLHL